jgi:flagellar biosynthesis regulator FlaF
MYEFAYNDVIEDSHQTLRAREQAAMDRVIGMLRAAQERVRNRVSSSTRCSISAVCGRFSSTISTIRTMSCRTSSEPGSSRSASG